MELASIVICSIKNDLFLLYSYYSTVTRRRVIITRVGVTTPSGSSLNSTFQNLVYPQRESGVTTFSNALRHQGPSSAQLTHQINLSSSLPSQIAASVRSNFPTNCTSRSIKLALHASKQALQSSSLFDTHSPHRIGCSIGMGISSVQSICNSHSILKHKLTKNISRHFVPYVLSNRPSLYIARHFNLQGPNLSHSSVCASSAHAIGDAMRMIQLGKVDAMICGGIESCIDAVSIAGFYRLQFIN